MKNKMEAGSRKQEVGKETTDEVKLESRSLDSLLAYSTQHFEASARKVSCSCFSNINGDRYIMIPPT